MYLHANAKLGLAGRFALVKAIEQGMICAFCREIDLRTLRAPARQDRFCRSTTASLSTATSSAARAVQARC